MKIWVRKQSEQTNQHRVTVYMNILVDASSDCRVPCYRAAVGYTLPRLRALQGSNLCEANSRKHQW